MTASSSGPSRFSDGREFRGLRLLQKFLPSVPNAAAVDSAERRLFDRSRRDREFIPKLEIGEAVIIDLELYGCHG